VAGAAAALWTLDGAFEVAAAGAVGVNLHQGAGQNLYTGEAVWLSVPQCHKQGNWWSRCKDMDGMQGHLQPQVSRALAPQTQASRRSGGDVTTVILSEWAAGSMTHEPAFLCAVTCCAVQPSYGVLKAAS
jgi:hypothetical protein